MKATVNRFLFATETFDSGSLGVMASVVHQFNRPGRYTAAVELKGRNAGTFTFDVLAESQAGELHVDLASLAGKNSPQEDCACKESKRDVPVVSTKGYVLFFASTGTGGYSVRVGLSEEAVFDSTQLSGNDLFATSLLRPARYTMRTHYGKQTGIIDVTFSKDRMRTLKQVETQYVDVTQDGFNPADVKVTSGQGIVFRIKDGARVVVEQQSVVEEPKASRARRFTRFREKPAR